MSFVDKCPKCGSDLCIVGFTASTSIPLYEDGFCTEDAKFMNTEDEVVGCQNADCGYVGPLEHTED